MPQGAIQYVTAGTAHACALITISGNEEIACWGENNTGQVGVQDGSVTIAAPSLISLADISSFSSLAARFDHTCALRMDENAGVPINNVFCWGSNERGESGSAEVSTPVSSPQYVNFDFPAQPVVDGLAIGRAHACALLENSQIYCWGDNVNQKLGVTLQDNPFTHIPQPVAEVP